MPTSTSRLQRARRGVRLDNQSNRADEQEADAEHHERDGKPRQRIGNEMIDRDPEAASHEHADGRVKHREGAFHERNTTLIHRKPRERRLGTLAQIALLARDAVSSSIKSRVRSTMRAKRVNVEFTSDPAARIRIAGVIIAEMIRKIQGIVFG